jgi:hypothetical protein
MLFDKYPTQKIIPTDSVAVTGNTFDQIIINAQIGLLIF